MAWTYTYDTMTPDGLDDPSEADDRIRETKLALQERLAVEHNFPLTGTEVSDADAGKHGDITTTHITNAGAMENAGAVANASDQSIGGNATVAGTLGVTGKATVGDGSKMATSAAPAADAELANKKYVDDQIAARSQSGQAVGTTDITINSDVWADMADMSIILTTTGGNVLLMFSASFKQGNENGGYIRFDYDGTPVGALLEKDYRGYEVPTSRQYLITGLVAGLHTFKVQWRRSGVLFRQFGTVTNRIFTAVEMP